MYQGNFQAFQKSLTEGTFQFLPYWLSFFSVLFLRKPAHSE